MATSIAASPADSDGGGSCTVSLWGSGKPNTTPCAKSEAAMSTTNTPDGGSAFK